MCIDYAVDMGAKVLNNSWGGYSYYAGLETAIENAGVAGVLFVASAGNSDLDNDVNPRYPTCFDFDNIIAVMATDHDDKKWAGSNWGETSVDLAAPGSNILSCSWPGWGYEYKSGTSMAAPHVSGACALIWSANPDLTYRQVKNILLDTVDTIPELQNETPCVSGGRLNLNNALVEATRNLADFNRDEVVNFLDYALFADTWQTTPSDVNDYNDIFDLDDNDSIDYNDLDIFTDDWLWQAEKV
jgi:subtilisin family serine protease